MLVWKYKALTVTACRLLKSSIVYRCESSTLAEAQESTQQTACDTTSAPQMTSTLTPTPTPTLMLHPDQLTARCPDLPPTRPDPKPLSGSAQALVSFGAGMFSGGSDAAAGPADEARLIGYIMATRSKQVSTTCRKIASCSY